MMGTVAVRVWILKRRVNSGPLMEPAQCPSVTTMSVGLVANATEASRAFLQSRARLRWVTARRDGAVRLWATASLHCQNVTRPYSVVTQDPAARHHSPV